MDWSSWYQRYVEAGVSPAFAYPEHALSTALTPQRMTDLGFTRMRLRSDPHSGVYWVGPIAQEVPDVWQSA